MSQNVFHRYEKKYLLNEAQYTKLREKLKTYMEVDDYGMYNIRNIYYDTSDYELIRTSLEKPEYKEKFRVRSYGAPDETSDVFLEIKKKYKGLVNKRRITLKKTEAEEYLIKGKKPEKTSQIFQEIEYVLIHYKLEPKVYLAYDRIALYGKEDTSFRVTFDQHIRSRTENLTLENDENTKELLNAGYYVMEVKISDAMPIWFVHILSELEIRGISFSKYGNVYRNQICMEWYQGLQKKETTA